MFWGEEVVGDDAAERCMNYYYSKYQHAYLFFVPDLFYWVLLMGAVDNWVLHMKLGAGADPHSEKARRHGLRGFRRGRHDECDISKPPD